jgi:hypothetical protein
LPKQLLPFFEKFEKIYLWLDSDEVGKRSAEKFASALGSNRTIIIDPSHYVFEQRDQSEEVKAPKDANDALRQGLNFKTLMSGNARWLE